MMYALLYMNCNTSIKNMKASTIKISHCNSFTWAERILQVQSKATCKRHIHKLYQTDHYFTSYLVYEQIPAKLMTFP